MSKPRAIILRTAGTNCDLETQHALEMEGFTAQRIHVYRLMDAPDRLHEFDLLVVPGGFSYGDDVSAGKILANQMLHRLACPLNAFVEAGKLILGICNGMQVLLKSGLLPWGEVDPSACRDASLGWNDSGQFVDRWVHLRAESDRCVFLPKGEVISLPIAHGEGKFIPRDEAVLDRLRTGDQLALRYVPAPGRSPSDEPDYNPNGSVEDIAGLCDPTGRVLGLMPHPERFLDITNHPQWTRRDVRRADGRLFFQAAAAYLMNR
jgi:phosphoribosylformylglycinamidine synthase subunit PurQ / glutaminase